MGVVKLEQQICENSAHERKNTLIMAGTIPPAQHAEDCEFIVKEQIREHLRLELAIDVKLKIQERISVTKVYISTGIPTRVVGTCFCGEARDADSNLPI